jgi:hypothetical protein
MMRSTPNITRYEPMPLRAPAETRLLRKRSGSRHGFVEHAFVALERHRQHSGGGEETDESGEPQPSLDPKEVAVQGHDGREEGDDRLAVRWLLFMKGLAARQEGQYGDHPTIPD